MVFRFFAGTGVITKKELRYFYTAFMDLGKLNEEKLDEMTEAAFHALTSAGDVKLDYHTFKLSFLNFLLGKQPNGPGQYLFGTVEPQTATCAFPIDYSAMNSTEEDIEPYRYSMYTKQQLMGLDYLHRSVARWGFHFCTYVMENPNFAMQIASLELTGSTYWVRVTIIRMAL